MKKQIFTLIELLVNKTCFMGNCFSPFCVLSGMALQVKQSHTGGFIYCYILLILRRAPLS